MHSNPANAAEPRPPLTTHCPACWGNGSFDDGALACDTCNAAGIVLASDQPTCDRCQGDETEPWTDNDVSGATTCRRCQGWGVMAAAQ